jgi:hypothetical protein
MKNDGIMLVICFVAVMGFVKVFWTLLCQAYEIEDLRKKLAIIPEKGKYSFPLQIRINLNSEHYQKVLKIRIKWPKMIVFENKIKSLNKAQSETIY